MLAHMRSEWRSTTLGAMASFSLSRDAHVDAPPETVHAILEDFRRWEGWSPWEEMDPDLERTFSGAEKGVGARYAWKGNKKVGSGSMEITGSTPQRIDIDLEFVEPFKASNKTAFELRPEGAGTRVVWTMTGDRGPLMSLLGRLFFDKAIAKDFDRGLAKLKALAEVPDGDPYLAPAAGVSVSLRWRAAPLPAPRAAVA